MLLVEGQCFVEVVGKAESKAALQDRPGESGDELLRGGQGDGVLAQSLAQQVDELDQQSAVVLLADLVHFCEVYSTNAVKLDVVRDAGEVVSQDCLLAEVELVLRRSGFLEVGFFEGVEGVGEVSFVEVPLNDDLDVRPRQFLDDDLEQFCLLAAEAELMQESVFFAEEVLEDDCVEALEHLHLCLDEGQATLEVDDAEVDGVGQQMRYSK